MQGMVQRTMDILIWPFRSWRRFELRSDWSWESCWVAFGTLMPLRRIEK